MTTAQPMTYEEWHAFKAAMRHIRFQQRLAESERTTEALDRE